MRTLFTIPKDKIELFALLLYWAIFLFSSAIIFLIGAYIVNITNLKKLVGDGLVIFKKMEPAHYETTFIFNNATGMNDVVMVFRPNVWKMEIQVDGLSDLVEVSETVYDRSTLLSMVSVTYSKGRIWEFLLIHSVNG